MRRIARPNRMRISRGIAPHLGGHQPMGTHPMSHILIDSPGIPRQYFAISEIRKHAVGSREPMHKLTLFIPALLLAQTYAPARAQTSTKGVPVEIVATATEYVPRTTTVSRPGHSYTDCSGTTSYFGRFDADTGRVSGTADTNTRCSTTFTPPSESTLTTYRRVNYTIAKDEHTLYLLSCTQNWRLSPMQSLIIGHAEAEKAEASGMGQWTRCPAFSIGTAYTLRVRNAS